MASPLPSFELCGVDLSIFEPTIEPTSSLDQMEEIPGYEALTFNNDLSIFEPTIEPTSSLDQMEEIPGYEALTFNNVTVPPPLQTSESRKNEDTLNHKFDVNPLTEEMTRSALVAYARKNKCGVKAARNVKFTSFKNTSVDHYELQTFTEKREISWKYIPVPYRIFDIDDSENGPAPLPWDIEATPSKLFVNEEKVIRVPHTESVKICHDCNGNGKIKCSRCSGRGWINCHMCYKYGPNNYSTLRPRCLTCAASHHGERREDCIKCSFKGIITCPSCKGHLNLLYFISLTVTWKLKKEQYFTEDLEIPQDMMCSVSGNIKYEEGGIKVLPIQNCSNEAIKQASVQFISGHLKNSDEHILAQHQWVRVVPITAVTYEWKGKSGDFYICGFENEVYAPEYLETFRRGYFL